MDLANTKEECVVTAQLLEQSSGNEGEFMIDSVVCTESSNRRYLPNNMDFGDSGFFDDFYLSQNSAMDSNIERNVSGATDSNEGQLFSHFFHTFHLTLSYTFKICF